MAKITATERERWVLYQLLAPLNHATRADRKRADRLWDALALDDVAEKVALYAPGVQVDQRIFDHVDTRDFELTSDQRDYVIDTLLGGSGLTTSGGRVLRRFEAEIVKGRDGDAAAAS